MFEEYKMNLNKFKNDKILMLIKLSMWKKSNKFFLVIFMFLSVFSLKSETKWVNKWKEVNVPAPFDKNYYLDVFFLKSNPNFGWICGHKGYILRTTDAGNTWQGANLPFPHQLESITFVNEKVGFVSGTNENSGNGAIYKSTDGGKTWFDITPQILNLELWGNYFVDENFGMVIGGGCGSKQRFFRTTDGGNKWYEYMYQYTSNKLSDIILTNQTGEAYAAGSGWVWKSINGGKDWNLFSQTGEPDWQEEITHVGSSFLLPFSKECNGNSDKPGGLRFSTNNGKSWQEFYAKFAMYGSFLIDPLKGWGCGLGGSLYFTCDGGKNWNLNNCGIVDTDLDDVFFVDDTTGWVVGAKIFRTSYENSQKIVTNQTIKICEGQKVNVSIDSVSAKYKWSNCSFVNSIEIDKEGDYSLYAYDDPCSIIKEFHYVVEKSKLPFSNILSFDSNLGKEKQYYCEGDTVVLKCENKYVSYLWNTGEISQSIACTKEGKYSIIITDTNGCMSTLDYILKFQKLPEGKIIKSNLNVCIGDSISLSSDSESPIHSNSEHDLFQWSLDKNENVISNNKSIKINKDGKYFLTLTNRFGCSRIVDSIDVVFRKDTNQIQISTLDSYIKFDTVFKNAIKCKNIQIKNNSWKPINIDQLFLKFNINFSPVSSQFPLIIPPFSFDSVQICFSPGKKGIDFDTVFIPDFCSSHSIKLDGYGDAENYQGSTRCGLIWKFKSTGFTKLSEGLLIPYPNPSTDFFEIDLLSDYEIQNEEIKVQLINFMGEKFDLESEISETNNLSSEFKSFKIKANIKSLNKGAYIINYLINDEIFRGKVIIN